MKTDALQTVKEYRNYIDRIPELIAKSYYKAEYFSKNLDLKLPTYYRKIREKAFTIDEVEKLTKLLYPKQAYLEEIKKDLEQSKKDFKEGKVTEHTKFMEEIRRDYL